MPVKSTSGLRERKKQQTRQHIFESARRLFAERGFEAVTVAEVARTADVSEVTVFNYFPTKEDLYYGGMQFFEEQLIEAVRERKTGQSALGAFTQHLLASADSLSSRERRDAVVRAARLMAASPSLLVREREIVDRYTWQLADLLSAETKAARDEVEPMAVAIAMMGVHRALVNYVRQRLLAGEWGQDLVADLRVQTRRALRRLDRGLADYAVRRK